jgi:hypothetical protein
MPDQFTLTLELGNEAMQTLDDIADTLRELADKLSTSYDTEGKVRDANGNTIGTFVVS